MEITSKDQHSKYSKTRSNWRPISIQIHLL